MRSSESSAFTSARVLRIYYAATLLFILLDYFLNINVRLAFLEAWPEMRALYYLLCFVCLGLMIMRPGWRLWIGTLESMLSLSLSLSLVSQTRQEEATSLRAPRSNLLITSRGLQEFASSLRSSQ